MAHAFQVLLHPYCEVILWSQGVFGSTGSALFNLNDLAATVDFAVFVFTSDDELSSRGSRSNRGRENLILELGIFLGILGARRVMMIAPSEGSIIPSDLAGLMYLRFESNAPSAADVLAPSMARMVEWIRQLGPRERMKASEPQLLETDSKAIAPTRHKSPKKSRKGDAGTEATNVSRSHVFISYSHKDSIWLERLQTMLKPLVRTGDVTLWDDTMIEPGREWRREIGSAVSGAKVALLLVSPSFLASEFVANDELPKILDLAANKKLIVLWAAISKSFWEKTKIAKYQATHDISKPLDGLPPAKRNQIVYDICVKIANAVEA